MRHEKTVDNYKINLKSQIAYLEFLKSQNTFGDSDFDILIAIERWLASKGVTEIEFKLASDEYAGRIFLQKAAYQLENSSYKKKLKQLK